MKQTIYVVQRYEPPAWRDVLSTKNEAKANEMLKTLGDKGRLQTFGPREK